jgi:hypothetical protein
MQARLLLKERRVLDEDRFADVTIWRLPKLLAAAHTTSSIGWRSS